MVIPPAAADEGMLTLDADACVDEAWFDDRPGVNVGGSGAKAPSMHRSAQKASMRGSGRNMAMKLTAYVWLADPDSKKCSLSLLKQCPVKVRLPFLTASVLIASAERKCRCPLRRMRDEPLRDDFHAMFD